MDGSANANALGGNQEFIPKGLMEFGEKLSRKLDGLDVSEHKAVVREALYKKLNCCHLVDGVKPECCKERGYGKELVYLDPEKRFTLLVLRWKPGAVTPVHGHAAWGVVGVHQGDLNICCFDLNEDATSVSKSKEVKGCPGDVACVDPAPEGIHTIGNCSDAEAYSIHIYGMDLSIEPDSINVYY